MAAALDELDALTSADIARLAAELDQTPAEIGAVLRANRRLRQITARTVQLERRIARLATDRARLGPARWQRGTLASQAEVSRLQVEFAGLKAAIDAWLARSARALERQTA